MTSPARGVQLGWGNPEVIHGAHIKLIKLEKNTQLPKQDIIHKNPSHLIEA